MPSTLVGGRNWSTQKGSLGTLAMAKAERCIALANPFMPSIPPSGRDGGAITGGNLTLPSQCTWEHESESGSLYYAATVADLFAAERNCLKRSRHVSRTFPWRNRSR